MARPRSVDDEVILEATRELVGELGPDLLTLAAVGARVALSPAALVQRFGSKRGLLLASAARSAGMVRLAYAEAEAIASSPIAALRGAATSSVAHIVRPEQIGHGLGFVRLDVVDPEFRVLAQEHSRAIAEGGLRLLEQAVRAGELARGTDVDALSTALLVAFQGAPVVWALSGGGGSLSDFIGAQLDLLLAPYLT